MPTTLKWCDKCDQHQPHTREYVSHKEIKHSTFVMQTNKCTCTVCGHSFKRTFKTNGPSYYSY